MNDLATLTAAAFVVGSLSTLLVTRRWARQEIRRAALFGDRRLRAAEVAAERYREQLEEVEGRLADLERSAERGGGSADSNGDRRNGSNGDRFPFLPHDDLQRIHGIGAVLERSLHAIDVTTFAEIAAWSERDIEEVAHRLNVFPGRIRRDRWVEGARRAYLEKYGREPEAERRAQSGAG